MGKKPEEEVLAQMATRPIVPDATFLQSAREVVCPACHALQGEACRDMGAGYVHLARGLAARAF